MNKDLEQYIDFCERLFIRLEQEGAFPLTKSDENPLPDSTNSESLLDSES